MLQVWYAVTAAGAWCLLYISRVVLFLSSLCHSQFTRFSPYRNRLWAQWPLLSISVSIETSRLSLHNISWCHPTLNLRPLRPPPTISSCRNLSVPITQRGRRKWRCNLFAQVSGQSSQRKLCPSPTTVSGSASSSCTCSNTTSTGPLLMIKQPHRSEMKMLKELLLRYSSTLMNVLKAVFWIFETLLNFKGCYRPSIKWNDFQPAFTFGKSYSSYSLLTIENVMKEI
jgi:hypothetical protein